MARVTTAILWMLVIVGVRSQKGVIESELDQLPKLFHLDNYERCLNQEDGVFCLGQFETFSDVEHQSTYALIQKYSQNRNLYNRTYLHRGYCLTSRCPGHEQNLSARFEQCVDKWAKYRYGLRARLHTLHYCQRHGSKPSNAPDTKDLPHRIFLYVVLFLLIMNAVGTGYDLTVDEKDQKIPILRQWSIHRNLRRLIYYKVETNPEKRINEPFHGMKALLIGGAIIAHAAVLAGKMYHADPRFMEKYLYANGPILGELTVITQIFVGVSNYLVAFTLLKQPPSTIGFHMFPTLILKRLIRLFPLYLLINGFASTWWASFGRGPIWPLIVNDECNICRRKFWATVGFLQNVFDHKSICLIQTWIISVDMQLHVFSLAAVIVLVKFRTHAVAILSALLAVAIGLTIHTSFKNNYRPFFFDIDPEYMRTYDSYSFVEFYVMPVNCLMVAICGLIMGYINQDLQDNTRRKRLRGIALTMFIMFFVFAYFCFYLKQSLADPFKISAMIIVERLIASIMISAIFYTMGSGFLANILRWPALKPFGRLSMAVSMVHWCVNTIIIGTRTTLQDYSVMALILETIGTWVISNVVAVPLTVMVEYPMQDTLEKILFLFIKK